jgi:hypothetical protein
MNIMPLEADRLSSFKFPVIINTNNRSQWPRGLKHELSSFARTLES